MSGSSLSSLVTTTDKTNNNNTSSTSTSSSTSSTSNHTTITCPPPFGIQDSPFLALPKFPATDNLYPNAMSGSNSDAEKAQLALGLKYFFSPVQWLVHWRRAENPSAKAGLRCIVQIGTVHACLLGKYKAPTGEIKLQRSSLRQSVAETHLYEASFLAPTKPAAITKKPGNNNNNSNSTSNSATNSNNSLGFNASSQNSSAANSQDDLKYKNGSGSLSSDLELNSNNNNNNSVRPPTQSNSSLSSKIRAEMLSSGRIFDGPRVLVIEADTMNVALQLRRIFKHTPGVFVPINGSVPGGFYRRGGPTPEEEVCRRSNLWSCLEDPYGHSCTVSQNTEGSSSSVVHGKRKWRYPLPEGACVYAPGVQIFRASEAEGYAFLPSPGKVSCICVPQDTVREYVSTQSKFKKTGGAVWKGATGEKQVEPRMAAKSASRYARKVEMILRIAVKEGRRILVLGAMGCGAHGTPPKHAAEIFRDVITNVDPKGESFDLIAFAILEDSNCFKTHNPDGNISPFAEVFTNGTISSLTELECTPEITEPDVASLTRRDSVFKRSKALFHSSETVNTSSNSTYSHQRPMTQGGGGPLPRRAMSVSNQGGIQQQSALSTGAPLRGKPISRRRHTRHEGDSKENNSMESFVNDSRATVDGAGGSGSISSIQYSSSTMASTDNSRGTLNESSASVNYTGNGNGRKGSRVMFAGDRSVESSKESVAASIGGGKIVKRPVSPESKRIRKVGLISNSEVSLLGKRSTDTLTDLVEGRY